MPFHLTRSMSLWPARGLFLGCATAVDLVVTGRFGIDIRGTTFDQPSKCTETVIHRTILYYAVTVFNVPAFP